MTRGLTTLALAATVIFSIAADANAWTRSGTITGPRGTSTVNGSGSCANGACSGSVTRTGPNGYSVTRQGTASCSGGVCSGSSQITGPRGGTIYRQGSISR
jgi:hypothetical protein